MNISVLLITYNEETCLQQCLDSISWSDDIIILDSFSTDNTPAIAQRNPHVRFYQRRFDDFSTQRNYGLHEITYQNDFVFMIDADEICPPDLQNELMKTVERNTPEVSLYYIRRKLFYKNKWMKHNTTYPVWIGRLVRPQDVRFTGIIHERLHSSKQTGFLSHHIYHYPFQKGLDKWIEKRILYSNLISEETVQNVSTITSGNFFSNNPVKRRQSMKKVYTKLPARWLIFFVYNFFIRLCFLDGYRGIEFILLDTWYEFIAFSKRSNDRVPVH